MENRSQYNSEVRRKKYLKSTNFESTHPAQCDQNVYWDAHERSDYEQRAHDASPDADFITVHVDTSHHSQVILHGELGDEKWSS